MTAQELSAFIAELGLSLPSVVLTAITNKVQGKDADLAAAGYDADDITLIKLYAGGIMAIKSGARQIKSQGAPSGASRSFDYGASEQALQSSLAILDPDDIMGALLPYSGGMVSFDVRRA